MRNIKRLLLLLSLATCGQLFAQQQVEFKNIKEVNSERLDFAPVPFGEGIIFTSSKSNRFLQCPSDNAGDYTDVYYAPKNQDGTFGEKKLLKGGINGKYNDGATTFSPDGKKMIFTRNNLNGPNANDTIDLKLYSADLEGETWVNVTPLPFNSDDWSTAHPALSNDGTLLVFASNRPGSMGGSMDLRYENGVWSIPVNLGPSVNTTSSELFPFIDEMGNLFFSSNRAGGEGGLDIYAATPGMGDEWNLEGNIGMPFNQSGDDVSFVPMNGATEGYMASDRGASGAKGMDDIYYWKRTPDAILALVQVIDSTTKQPIPLAGLDIEPKKADKQSFMKYGPVLDKLYGKPDVKFILENTKMQLNGTGDPVEMMVYKGGEYTITASKSPEYKSKTKNPSTADLVEKEVYIIELAQDNPPRNLTICAVEEGTDITIPLADIKVLDKTTGKVVNLTADGGGCTNLQINCEHDYEITVSKSPYYTKTISLRDLLPMVDCKKTPDPKVKVPLEKPLIVILEPIFYDFDRYYIRKRDAAPTLDSLVIIMNKYPSLQVRLDAHADARGATSYNDILSANRANSAKKYLVKRGISADRVTTKDFGERNPVNECKDNVYCPEPAHQLNRRVDVTAVSHKEENVEFKTKDLKQMNVESDRK
jgi:outer membrane protein OmpA-like peptidoglycan-associated protein